MYFTLFLNYFMLQFHLSNCLFSHPFRQVAFKSNPYIKDRTDCKKIVIDIDGTICSKTKSDYENAEPIFENIDIFNQLYEKGNEIHYWTSRGALSGKNWDEITVNQLKQWNVKFNSINMGKPHYDLWIDDKAYNAIKFCKDI